jgi:sugar phosphate isomerase/epimerase
MTQSDFSFITTRRQLLAGTLALAAGPLYAQKKYSPRIVCNVFHWVQLFSTAFRYVSPNPDPLKAPPPSPQPAQVQPIGGIVWTDEQWHRALSEVQYAGYRRMEMISETVVPKPMEDLQALLKQYGLVVNHLWHAGPLYPASAQEKTIRTSIEALERSKPIQCREFFFDPFGDRGPLSDDEARLQNRGLDRIGREAKDRGMKMCVHNHQGPMRYGAKEWRGVVSHTDPDSVFMCLDLDWTLQAGTDPLPLLYLAGDQDLLGAIHVRTQHKLIMDQTMEDGGDIDFYKVAAYLKKIQFDGPAVEETAWMKETKVTRSSRENKRVAREWCEKVFGVSAKA